MAVADRFPAGGDEGDDSGEGDSDAGGDDQPMMADPPPKTMGAAAADSAGDTSHWSTSWSN